MPAGLVVRSGSMHRPIILRHVKVNRPGTQGTGYGFKGLMNSILIVPIVPFRHQPMFRRIVPHDVQQRVRHVGLKAKPIRPADGLQ